MLSKTLTLIFLIVATWWVFRRIDRFKAARRRHAEMAARREQAAASRGPAGGAAEDMVRCPACGVFVAARGAAACARDDCPYRRR
ncbi:MAG: hypothetical protein GC191_11945 [Azospirillum sp.]|nr:hypothetical protein [Azospirillum sp.]